jgi:hypothetical protein
MAMNDLPGAILGAEDTSATSDPHRLWLARLAMFELCEAKPEPVRVLGCV